MVAKHRFLVSVAAMATGSVFASGAQAQGAGPTNLVSVCSGVSLPRSVITDTLAPVITGVVTPIQNTVNPILGVVGGAIPTVPPLSIDATGLLNTAAAGQPVRLQVLNTNGVLVGPGARCDAQADSFTLTTPGGVAIGGNSISGLGTTGQQAIAGAPDAIAIGNLAITDPSAGGALALGAGARVNAGAAGSLALGAGAIASSPNAVALGAGSIADRGVAEVSVGAPGAERLVTNVAAGVQATDAANVGQVNTVAGNLATLASRAVVYDDALLGRVTLAGAGGTVLTNVAPGALGPGSTDAVNGAQLAATNQAVAANTAAITNLSLAIGTGGATATPVRYADPGSPTTPNGGTMTNDAVLVGAAPGPVALHGVAAGAVAAGSTDAVNGAQLATVSGEVGANTTAITNLGVTVAGNTAAITNLTSQVANGATGPVRYSSAGTPTTPSGVPSNDVTLVGAVAGPVGLHDVAAGLVAAGSTDAVNGGQLAAVQAANANAVSYDTDATGARGNSVTLAGGTAGAVAVRNVAAGTLAVGSTDAVNGGQLAATNATLAATQTTSANALALGQNAVQYDTGRGGVTLDPGGAAAAIHNVGAGTTATDAANVGQLSSGMAATLAQAQGYTDAKLAAVSFDVRNARRDAAGGSATALAAAGLPQAFTPGANMIAIGGGTYGGESAVAFGFSKAFGDGHTIVRLSGSRDTRGRTGANGGIGYQF